MGCQEAEYEQTDARRNGNFSIYHKRGIEMNSKEGLEEESVDRSQSPGGKRREENVEGEFVCM